MYGPFTDCSQVEIKVIKIIRIVLNTVLLQQALKHFIWKQGYPGMTFSSKSQLQTHSKRPEENLYLNFIQRQTFIQTYIKIQYLKDIGHSITTMSYN